MKLTARQQRFAQLYAEMGNGRQAALVAGYSPKAADSIAHDYLHNPQFSHVAEAVDIYKGELAARAHVSQEKILAALKAIAFVDVTEAFTVAWRMKDVDALPADVRQCIAEVVPLKGGVVRVKFADKLAALTRLGDFLGLWERKQSQTGMALTIHLTQQQAMVTAPGEQVTRGPMTLTRPTGAGDTSAGATSQG
ncbi:MAG: terminase small subunit [Nitrospinae bacterium]|nr:terminase small subunit [Nitrospinota bacterium]